MAEAATVRADTKEEGEGASRVASRAAVQVVNAVAEERLATVADAEVVMAVEQVDAVAETEMVPQGEAAEEAGKAMWDQANVDKDLREAAPWLLRFVKSVKPRQLRWGRDTPSAAIHWRSL